MGVHRLNHAVLWVHDVDASVEFYAKALGFAVVSGAPGRVAFLKAPQSTNDHDLGLFQMGKQAGPSEAGSRRVGMYHLSWEVDTLQDLKEASIRLSEMGALVGSNDHGTSKSLYAKDPSGLEFEVQWMIPLDRITQDDLDRRGGGILNIDREIARFGPNLPSGIGISRPKLPAEV